MVRARLLPAAAGGGTQFAHHRRGDWRKQCTSRNNRSPGHGGTCTPAICWLERSVGNTRKRLEPAVDGAGRHGRGSPGGEVIGRISGMGASFCGRQKMPAAPGER